MICSCFATVGAADSRDFHVNLHWMANLHPERERRIEKRELTGVKFIQWGLVTATIIGCAVVTRHSLPRHKVNPVANEGNWLHENGLGRSPGEVTDICVKSAQADRCILCTAYSVVTTHRSETPRIPSTVDRPFRVHDKCIYSVRTIDCDTKNRRIINCHAGVCRGSMYTR